MKVHASTPKPQIQNLANSTKIQKIQLIFEDGSFKLYNLIEMIVME